MKKPGFFDQYTRIDELLEQNTVAVNRLADILQLKGDTIKPLFLTYPSSGSALVTISEGTTILNFETGTITDIDGEVTNMKQSLQNRGFEWARSFFIQSDKMISVQIDDNDPLISGEERDAYGIHQQFKKITLTAYENTDVFVIVSTSPDALIQMVSNIFVMKGLGASGYPVAVDVNGYLTTIIYGDQGAIAQDANKKLISVMQGSQGIDVAQQAATGELVSVMQGDDGGTLRTIAVDANARLEAVMKGIAAGTPTTVRLDAAGNIIAVMKGEYDSALQTIALDSQHRMIARTLTGIEYFVRDYSYKSADNVTYDEITSTAVGADKIWNITDIVAYNMQGWTDKIRLKVGTIGSYKDLHFETDLPTHYFVEWHGSIWLEQTETILAGFYGVAALGNTIKLYTHGIEISAV